jgi:membrane-associated protease RseP (regulator of RpoE activity)
MTGAEHVTAKVWFDFGMGGPDSTLSWHELGKGLPYSLSFLTFLTFHEFGHYFTSAYHRVKSSLPYYIPIFIPFMLNIGSFGAVIRIKEPPQSTRKYFDIGIAGPIAGFCVSLALLTYGFATLPPMEEYVLNIHPEYLRLFGGVPDMEELRAFALQHNQPVICIGSSLIFEFFKMVIPVDPCNVPPPYEIMHYPFLFVGFITLFFTALNLLPMGQLDGGHVIYGLFGRKRASLISRVTVVVLLLIGGTGFMDFVSPESNFLVIAINMLFSLYVFDRIFPAHTWQRTLLYVLPLVMAQALLKGVFPEIMPGTLWLLYAFLVVRFLGVDHPPALHEHRLNSARTILGWIAILLFILCFSPVPVYMIGALG